VATGPLGWRIRSPGPASMHRGTRITPEAQVARILVVDDDPAIREYVRDVLELEDHEVRFAEDGLSVKRINALLYEGKKIELLSLK